MAPRSPLREARRPVCSRSSPISGHRTSHNKQPPPRPRLHLEQASRRPQRCRLSHVHSHYYLYMLVDSLRRLRPRCRHSPPGRTHLRSPLRRSGCGPDRGSRSLGRRNHRQAVRFDHSPQGSPCTVQVDQFDRSLIRGENCRIGRRDIEPIHGYRRPDPRRPRLQRRQRTVPNRHIGS